MAKIINFPSGSRVHGADLHQQHTVIIRCALPHNDVLTMPAVKVNAASLPIRLPVDTQGCYACLRDDGSVRLVLISSNDNQYTLAENLQDAPAELEFWGATSCPVSAKHADLALGEPLELLAPIVDVLSACESTRSALQVAVSRSYYEHDTRLVSIRDILGPGYGPRKLGDMMRSLWWWAWPELALVARSHLVTNDLQWVKRNHSNELMCRVRAMINEDAREMTPIDAV